MRNCKKKTTVGAAVRELALAGYESGTYCIEDQRRSKEQKASSFFPN